MAPRGDNPGRRAEDLSSTGIGQSIGSVKPDPLSNPLRAVLTTFACKPCGRFDPDGRYGGVSVGFQCGRCLAGFGSESESRAYCSLMYGDLAQYVCGALALGCSLRESGTAYDCVLLHTPDVPGEVRRLLEEFWQMTEVAYIPSAHDLHTSPYEKSKFKEVFTKLHVFNPAALPYDRVVFLDLDTLVLRNIDDLFSVRPPAAMCNMKTRAGHAPSPPRHGHRMEPRSCYFNAGTMVVAPSWPLFELLAADVQEPDPQWHTGAWAPEQNYLSRVLAGEWSHLSQLFNLEVQLHSGVPVSEIWERSGAVDVAVAHFSGATKVWDMEPEHEVQVVGSVWVKQAFSRLHPKTRSLVQVRCKALHAEWNRVLAVALRQCRERGLADHLVGTSWTAALRTGCRPRPLPPSSSGEDCPNEEDGASAQKRLKPTALLVGDDICVQHDMGNAQEGAYHGCVSHLAKVLRVKDDNSVVVWRTPLPSEDSFSKGPFGLCYIVGEGGQNCLIPLCDLSTVAGSTPLGLGTDIVAWSKDGHLRGVVRALDGEDRLVSFAEHRAPQWFVASDLLDDALDGEPPVARPL